MEHNVVDLTLLHILDAAPGLKHWERDLIIPDSKSSYSSQGSKIFKYPIRQDGVGIYMHRAGEEALEIFVNMKRHVFVGNQLFICKPGDILETEGGVVHPRFVLISQAFLQATQIGLETIMPAFVLLQEHPIYDLSEEEMNILSFYYDLLEENIEKKGQFQKEILLRMTALYLYNIGNILYGRKDEFLSNERFSPSRDTVIFNSFIALVATHHRKERRVDFYAEKLYLTPKYLSAVIKKVSGRPAGEWIDGYVILEAKSLLKHSAMSVQEIAYYMNFPNPSFFGKYFKRQTGMSPNKYKVL